MYNALAAVAAQKYLRSLPAWTEARSQSRTQGGVGPVAGASQSRGPDPSSLVFHGCFQTVIF